MTTTGQPSPAVTLPPGPNLPRAVQGALVLANRRRTLAALRARYGSAFSLHLPVLGAAVVLADPAEVRQMYRTGTDELDNSDRNLGRLLGPNSMFALTGERHRGHRKLLTPPFHGRSLEAHATLMAEQARAEFAHWPEGREFATQPAMMRLTLNIILRAVFGAEGREFEQLRELLPRLVEFGSKLSVLPLPQWDLGGRAPWGRYWSMRRRYDSIVDTLIAKARHDPGFDDRDDVLALMLRARYDDGSALTRAEIADELLTMLSAGHETTATTLAWAVERLRRHPAELATLVAELDAGGDDLLTATITEVQRVRPVIDLTIRQTRVSGVQLGRWTLPRGQLVVAAIGLLHRDPELYDEPAAFRPERFAGAKPDTSAWIPFGGGVRRCIGAAFAQLELKVVLGALLREFELLPTAEPDERWHLRGVAYAPGRGGRAMVRRRAA